jgi:hypothetical protein
MKNGPAGTGSQEVASSILASSTNKINNLPKSQQIPKSKKVTIRFCVALSLSKTRPASALPKNGEVLIARAI